MENSIKKFRIRVKKLNSNPLSEAPHVQNAEAPGPSSKKSSRRSALLDEHKVAFINYEKDCHVLMLKLKASHTLWQEMSAILNAIKSEKGPREPSQWRSSILNWRNRVMAKNKERENLSPTDTAAREHWKNPC